MTWSTRTIRVTVGAQEGGAAAIAARAADPVMRTRIREEWRSTRLLDWDEVVVSLVDDDLQDATLGHTIEAAAERLGLHPDEAALELIARTEDRVQMIAFGRHAEDLDAVLRHPAASIGSDGLALDPDGPTGVGRPHPRSYGCYPRLLGHYVRETGTISLERAVAMSTSIPAERVGLTGRGLVGEGMSADVVVFDPDRIIDRATFDNPAVFPEGVVHVFVNGRAVVRDEMETRDDAASSLPGRILGARSP